MTPADSTSKPLTIKLIHLWLPTIVAIFAAGGAWATRAASVEGLTDKFDNLKDDVHALRALVDMRESRFAAIEKALYRIEGKLGIAGTDGR